MVNFHQDKGLLGHLFLDKVNRGIIDYNGQKLAKMLNLKVLVGHYGCKKHKMLL